MAITTSTVWPTNEKGEIIFGQGTGSVVASGWLNEASFPVDSTTGAILAVGLGGNQATISGNYRVGQVLTAAPSPGYSFTTGQWKRNGTAISGATALTYTQVTADIGTTISFTPTSPVYAAIGGVTTAASITVPGAPTIGSLVAGDGLATANWTAPTDNGGTAITGYKVTASNGNIVTAAANATSIAVPGTNGNAFTVVVQALNSIGYGPVSATSNSATPTAAVVATNRNVINRANMGNQIYGSALQVDGHTLQKVFTGTAGPLTRSRVVFANTATYLDQSNSAQTYKCSVEFPVGSGTLFHYTFGGSNRTGTAAANTLLISDYVDHFPIPDGSLVMVRVYCTSPTGCVVSLGGAWRATGTSAIDRFDFSNTTQATTNIDNTETASATYNTLVPNMYATQNFTVKPAMIQGMSTANSIAYIGDSRGAGASADIDLAPLGLVEHLERIGGFANPGINFCMSNEKASDFVNPARRTLAKQVLAMNVCQIAHLGHGTNSMDGVTSSELLIDEDRQMVTLLQGLGISRFWRNTVPVRIGGLPTDRLTTYASQGLSTGNTRRLDLNNWIKANAEGLFERVYDVVQAYNDSTSGTEKITIAPRARTITADYVASTGILTLTGGTQFTSADEKYGAFSSGWTAFTQGGGGTTYSGVGRSVYLKILSATTATLHEYHGQQKRGGADSVGQTVYVGADMPSQDGIHYGILGNPKVTTMFQNTVAA